MGILHYPSHPYLFIGIEALYMGVLFDRGSGDHSRIGQFDCTYHFPDHIESF